MTGSYPQQKQNQVEDFIISQPSPVIAFYGDGKEKLGPLLEDFFCTDLASRQKTELCNIMMSFGSDKGSTHHNYTLLYNYLFYTRRHEIRQVFELGLGSNFVDTPSNMGRHGSPGASLRGWRRYFPNAHITGADVDRRVLFSDDRIGTHYVDQISKPDIDALWKSFPDEYFDIMIDDGWHEFEPNAVFIYHSLKKLKSGGYYIVEDIGDDPENLKKYDDYFSKGSITGALIKLPIEGRQPNNCVAIFQPVAPADKSLLPDPEPFLRLAERTKDREDWAREHPHYEGWQYLLQRWQRSLIKKTNVLRRVFGFEPAPVPPKF